jgi:hypothetical protein
VQGEQIVSDEWNGGRHDASGHDSAAADELERQAREALAEVRERIGDLGGRVRRVVERANAHWEASAAVPAPTSTEIQITAGARARALARRWVDVDFLVDPELAAGLSVHTLESAGVWRVEVRERGEARLLEERSEPYRGTQPAQGQPTLPVWDYVFPLTPEIEAGERRERLPGTGSVRACRTCNGTGQRPCRSCEGRGFVTCPRCRGRARLTCPRCRGRGQIPDAAAERRARSGMPYLQVHAERLAAEASERVADFAERMRQEWGVPLPPSREWMPSVAASGETVPCPDCMDGTQPCDCGNGKRVCAVCEGSGHEECSACKGTGRVVRHREVVRRFDTRVGVRALPVEERMASWVPQDVLARGRGESIWEGVLEEAGQVATPQGVPEHIWRAALAFAGSAPLSTPPQAASEADQGERRVLTRRLALVRLPLTRMEYGFAGQHFVVVAFGREGAERFWAETFPHRWSRVGRFLQALARDLSDLGSAAEPLPPPGRVSVIEEYRARKNGADTSLTPHSPSLAREGGEEAPAAQPPTVEATFNEAPDGETPATDTSAGAPSQTAEE